MGCNVLLSNSNSYERDSRNPNPLIFEIERILQVGEFVIAKIRYVGCTNYEGRKVLVWKGVSKRIIEKRKSIDPHFTEAEPNMVARFAPTALGWKLAISLAQSYGANNESAVHRRKVKSR